MLVLEEVARHSRRFAPKPWGAARTQSWPTAPGSSVGLTPKSTCLAAGRRKGSYLEAGTGSARKNSPARWCGTWHRTARRHWKRKGFCELALSPAARRSVIAVVQAALADPAVCPRPPRPGLRARVVADLGDLLRVSKGPISTPFRGNCDFFFHKHLKQSSQQKWNRKTDRSTSADGQRPLSAEVRAGSTLPSAPRGSTLTRCGQSFSARLLEGPVPGAVSQMHLE